MILFKCLKTLGKIGYLVTMICITAPHLFAQADNTRTTDFWRNQGELSVQQALSIQANTGRAKNIILFVGDGNGVSTVTATRIFDGQSRGQSGEENRLSYERFAYAAFSKTYNTNQQTPDSAGTMTAIITGVKTRAGILSIGPENDRADCHSGDKYVLPTLLEQAQKSGRATGIVTTARITHATPAATYAHTSERNWEGDAKIPDDMKTCGRDIARQLIESAANLDVIMGGGRRHFYPQAIADMEYPDQTGQREDGRNLIAEWQEANLEGLYVWNQQQFDAISPGFNGKILGLFEPSHMHFEADREALGKEPSLAEMTAKAIDRLDQSDTGFVLMVEGGRIDHAHHAGNAYRALTEGQELSRAVQVAVDKTNPEDTLIIVTADHSHVFTLAGYPVRGNPILGKVVANDTHGQPKKTPELAADGQPYTTVGYMNGPGYGIFDTIDERVKAGGQSGRMNITTIDTTQKSYFQESLVPSKTETHGGEDVAIYAQGPWAHLFHGVHEQNYIYHVMAHALGLSGGN